MSNPYFRFKQFTVRHDQCAMKVGTDGVLLGVWTNVTKAVNILDVGSGSGLVALMLAQRNLQSKIDAIEIDVSASIQANENFNNSPFNNLSACINTSFQEFGKISTKRYDLIVSNPPFFCRSLKSPDAQRSTARHTDNLLIEEFIAISAKLLNKNGRISFIFPSTDKDYLIATGKENGLCLSRLTNVYPTPQSDVKRVLIEFANQSCETEISDLIIEIERHTYSPEFTSLAKDFYLKL